MGKYDPLKVFLLHQSGDDVAMTFAEIEGLPGSPLPNSKQYPAWWSNNPSNNTMTKAWLDAGFVTEQVDTFPVEGRFFAGPTPMARRRRDQTGSPGCALSSVAQCKWRQAGT